MYEPRILRTNLHVLQAYLHFHREEAMTTSPNEDWLDKLIEKFADYCACDEYHYGEIDGRPGNHDPNDGHMDFDEEAFKAAIEQHIVESQHLHSFDETNDYRCKYCNLTVAELNRQKEGEG
jgi:hypothetical protein